MRSENDIIKPNQLRNKRIRRVIVGCRFRREHIHCRAGQVF
ncbi:Uncharacterised protein [Klebsiella pneumoniae]|nr:Uncharacterised protein [Klebsiella pneumoniae]